MLIKASIDIRHDIKKIYTKNGGASYHAKQHIVGIRAFALIARNRAEKLSRFIREEDKVFEFGVGGGFNLARLKCGQRLGYDISSCTQEVLAKHRVPVVYRMEEVPEKHFDVALCHRVLEHVTNPFTILQSEISRTLKPGGDWSHSFHWTGNGSTGDIIVTIVTITCLAGTFKRWRS